MAGKGPLSPPGCGRNEPFSYIWYNGGKAGAAGARARRDKANNSAYLSKEGYSGFSKFSDRSVSGFDVFSQIFYHFLLFFLSSNMFCDFPCFSLDQGNVDVTETNLSNTYYKRKTLVFVERKVK